jgi:hypothetical protein
MVVDWEAWRSMEELAEAPGVYVILFRNPPSAYVGCTSKSFAERWLTHHTRLRQGTHRCQALQERYNEQGTGELELLVMSVVIGWKDLYHEEAACLKHICDFYPWIEVLNEPADFIWHRAKKICWDDPLPADEPRSPACPEAIKSARYPLGLIPLDFCIQKFEDGGYEHWYHKGSEAEGPISNSGSIYRAVEQAVDAQ